MQRRKVGKELNREILLDENTQLIKTLITLIKNRKGGA
jgi:hypothetical protein